MKYLQIKNWMIVGALTTCIACNNASNTATVPSDFNVAQLLDHIENLDQILTGDMVANVSQSPKDKLYINYEDYSSAPAEHTLAYSWASGKDIKVGNGKQTIAQYYSLGIANVQAMTAAAFEQKMGTAAGLQHKVDALAKDTMLSKDVAVAEALYLKEYAAEQQITAVNGVGNKAYWEMPLQVLHVFANDVAFTITANMGEDAAQNKSAAIAIANEIFNSKN